MFSELLSAKPCRIIWKLPQTLSFGTKACKIEPTVWKMGPYRPVWARPGPLSVWARPGPLKSGKSLGKTCPFSLNAFLRRNVGFDLQTTCFDSFNVLLSFLAEKWYRTNMKLPQQASFGHETCEMGPKVWLLASCFCFLRLWEPSGRFRGNPRGRPPVRGF